MEIAFMKQAILLAEEKMKQGHGGPFGAVIVKKGKIISQGYNRVTSTNDPTAHAEIVAIREAAKALDTFQLSGCEIYINCEPCPMCLAGLYWAGIEKIYYAATRKDAADIGFADNFIYDELQKKNDARQIKMTQVMRQEALHAFEEWSQMENKIKY